MKKGLRTICAFLLLLSFKGISQTTVSGRLTENTTWTSAGSPYMLNGNVEVPTGVTLTIEAGSTIERSSKTQIIVNGTIMANGSASDSITFKTDDISDISTPPYIEFSKCNLTNSSLRFLSFKSLTSQGKNIRIGSANESASPVKNSGILSIARSNLSDGNIVSHGFNSGTSMNIDSCYFDSSIIHCLESYSEKINITNSTILNSTMLADELSYGIEDSNCTIENTIIESGAYTSVSVVSSLVKASIFNIPENSTLYINKSTVNDSPVFGSPGGIVNIDASQLAANNADTTLYPKINSVPYFITAYQANITNSTFSGVPDIDAIAINGTGGDTTTTIAHNTFTKFGDAVTVYNFSSQIHVDSNNFQGINTYDIINFSTRNFDAIYDYYQLSGNEVVNDVIYDHRDNPTYGFVNYIPVATDPVLPLHLIGFTGLYTNNLVTLKWQTSNEVNSSSFVIQHLINGNYQDIGNVSAKGGASNSYSFSSGSLSDGANIYRLKMIDKDGSYTFSNSISVDVSSGILSIRIYPNPATGYILVNHTKAEAGSQLQLTDMTGKIIKTLIVAKDDVQNKIATDDLAKGIYKITWRNGTTTQSGTVLLQ